MGAVFLNRTAICSADICRHVPAACAGVSEPLQLQEPTAEEHVCCDRRLLRPDRLLADAWDWPQLPHAQHGKLLRATYHQNRNISPTKQKEACSLMHPNNVLLGVPLCLTTMTLCLTTMTRFLTY